MKITNASTQTVYWRTFKATDEVYSAGLEDGVLQPGASVVWETSELEVKIEFKQDSGIGPAIVPPTLVVTKDVTLTEDQTIAVDEEAAPPPQDNLARATATKPESNVDFVPLDVSHYLNVEPIPGGQNLQLSVIPSTQLLLDGMKLGLDPHLVLSLKPTTPTMTVGGLGQTCPRYIRSTVPKGVNIPNIDKELLDFENRAIDNAFFDSRVQYPFLPQSKVFRLTTEWQGDGKALDVVNGSPVLNNKQPTLSQAWAITALGDGYCRVGVSSESKSLRVQVSSTQDVSIVLADSQDGNHKWKYSTLLRQMEITNDYARRVYWRTFNASDTVCLIGLKDGVLQPGESTTWETSVEQVKIEFKQDSLFGQPIVSPSVVATKRVTLTKDKRVEVINGPAPDGYRRLTSLTKGSGKSLDILNAGQKNQLMLGDSSKANGQKWKVTEITTAELLAFPLYRLTTAWQGDDKALDVVDGKPMLNMKKPTYSQAWRITELGNGYARLQACSEPSKSLDLAPAAPHTPFLADSHDYTGQKWKRAPVGGGYHRLTTLWQGDGKSLDVVNDGQNKKLMLDSSSSASGQRWKLTEIPAAERNGFAPLVKSSSASRGVAAILAELVRIATLGKARPDKLTDLDRLALTFFSELVREKRVEVAQAAIAEYALWQANPTGNLAPSLIGSLFSAPKPPPVEKFSASATAKVYKKLVDTKGEEYLKEMIVGLSGLTLAVVAAGSTAGATLSLTSGTAGAALFATIFPHAAANLGLVTSTMTGVSSIGVYAAGAGGVAGILIIAVTIGVLEGISVVQAAEVPYKLQQKLAEAKANAPDLGTMVASENGMRELTAVVALACYDNAAGR